MALSVASGTGLNVMLSNHMKVETSLKKMFSNLNFAGGGVCHPLVHSQVKPQLGRVMERPESAACHKTGAGVQVPGHPWLHQPEGGGGEAVEAEAGRGVERQAAGLEHQLGDRRRRDQGGAEGWGDCHRVCQVRRGSRLVEDQHISLPIYLSTMRQ